MDFSYVAAISASGMDVERARLDAAAINLANAHTTRTAEGRPYKPLRVVSTFSSTEPFSGTFSTGIHTMPGARLVDIRGADVAPRLAYEPGHPDADPRGFVAYPGVDPTLEMVNLMTAVRSYEANVIAMNAAKVMTLKALEIGGSS